MGHNYLGGTKWGCKTKGNQTANFVPFEKGNRLSADENIPEASRKRRLAGLRHAWATSARKHRGEKVMSMHRKRQRLRENLQAEAREIQNIARTYAVSAMNKLADIVENSQQDSSVIAAAQVIFERAYGKATQTSINANIDANGKPTEVTSKELDTRIAETLRRVESLTGGAPQAEKGEERPADLRVGDRDPGGSSVH